MKSTHIIDGYRVGALMARATVELNCAAEELVDKFGVQGVMWALARVIDRKAERLRSEWEDEGEAMNWEAISPFLLEAIVVAKTRGIL